MRSIFSSSPRLASFTITLIALFHLNSYSVHSFAPSSSSTPSSKTSILQIISPARPFTHIQASNNANDGSRNRINYGLKGSPHKNNLPTAITSAIVALSLLLQPIATPPASASDYASFTTEQRFISEAWRQVDNAYIDRTFNHQDWFQLRQDALKKKYKSMDEARSEVEKLLGSLGDRYTRYLTPAKYDSIVNAATGNVYGVGVELAQNKEAMRVIASDVEPNGPAAKGGLKPKDVFMEVDGVRFDDGKATPDDVAVVVRGPEGSKVGVVVERDGKTVDFILTREPIKITSVRSYIGENSGVVDGKVGVIRIKSFSGTTAETVKSELEGLKKKGATKFVLDLRGNPGGLLPGGVDTASLFLEANRPVVFVANKNGVVDTQSTLGDGVDLSSQLVLLVDRNTASAAEVMTAALKENKRSTVVGEQTFGKGIVQTIRQFEGGENGGVAVTIARYETPEHHDINKQGIPVDVETNVDCGKEDALTCLSKEAFKKI
mmetsp:Transcript_11583/g.20857  ORF Transcript_11583/g.20857 Transcript_11583/m.20857 type:complete len:492 (-) Transcript_11583:188-1663(-)